MLLGLQFTSLIHNILSISIIKLTYTMMISSTLQFHQCLYYSHLNIMYIYSLPIDKEIKLGQYALVKCLAPSLPISHPSKK